MNKHNSIYIFSIILHGTLIGVPAHIPSYQHDRTHPYFALLYHYISPTTQFQKSYTFTITPETIEQTATKTEEKRTEQGFEINYFDNNLKNIGRKIMNLQRETTSFIIFQPHNKQTQIAYNKDRTISIEEFDNHQFKQATTINNQHQILSFKKKNNDDSIQQITYNPDQTKIISEFDAQKNERQRTTYNAKNTIVEILTFNADRSPATKTTFDTTGNPVETMQWDPTGTSSRTLYKPDGTQIITYFGPDTKYTGQGYIDIHGKKIDAEQKLITAWHEAGHAIMALYTNTMSLIDKITIKPETFEQNNTLGHVKHIHTYHDKQTIEELENNIMVSLAGGIGEQILFNKPMLIQTKEIITYFENPSYATDMKNVYEDLQQLTERLPQTIISKISSYLQSAQDKNNEKIVQLYQKAYQFLLHKKAELLKLAQHLMHKETIYQDEIYNFLNVDKPLMQYEQGPLPFNLASDYQHRGFKS